MKNHLTLAVTTFVLLDLGTLAFSYTIAHQVEKDAVAINLAGRQRMLSQKITKAALLATSPTRSEHQQAESALEVRQAYQTFRRTLAAFDTGGDTLGGDGQIVRLDPVRGQAGDFVGAVRTTLQAWPEAPASGAELAAFSQFMGEHNGAILDAMNRLTSELEHQSVAAVWRLRIAQTLAFILSLANFTFILIGMHRARLEAEAASVTDPLTGLLNRGGLYQALDTALERCASLGQPLGVMLLDLDGFKAVNDTYGHAAGDNTLREVARRLLCQKGNGWIFGRLGGDEFAVICPGLAPDALAAAARQIGAALSDIPGGELRISASVGWAACEDRHSADEVIAAADAMMYTVKNNRHTPGRYRHAPRDCLVTRPVPDQHA